MNAPTDIDYKNNLFEHPELTRIIGEPTTASLITLQAEVRDNAQAVQSDLGGGQHGHLGLVCTQAAYTALVPQASAYTRPVNPGRLAVTPNLTQYQLAQARDVHQEAIRVFREVNGVERAIIQQIVVAIEPKYLRALRTPGTNKLNQSIPDILTHLFTTYGDVTPSDLRELTSRVENLIYPPAEPVDTIFSEIDDLAAIAEIATAPLTVVQKINMAYIHFQKTNIYKTALNKWDEKAPADKTWDNFKDHLRAAHKALRRTGALTLNDTLNRDQVMNMVSEGVFQALQSFTPPDTTSESSPSTVPSHDDVPPLTNLDATSQSANSTTSDLTLQTLQQQMELMRTMMQQMQSMQSSNYDSRRNNRPNRRFNTNPNQTKYCWTHGLCSHHSRDCRTKADGHQDGATKDNRMGGSTRNMNVPE